MSENFYQSYFEKAFAKIKKLRDPTIDPTYDKLKYKQYELVKIKDQESESYEYILQKTNIIIYSTIKNIIMKLLSKNGVKFRYLPDTVMMEYLINATLIAFQKNKEFSFNYNDYRNVFSIVLENKNQHTIYLFKDFGLPDDILIELKKLLTKQMAITLSEQIEVRLRQPALQLNGVLYLVIECQ